MRPDGSGLTNDRTKDDTTPNADVATLTARHPDDLAAAPAAASVADDDIDVPPALDDGDGDAPGLNITMSEADGVRSSSMSCLGSSNAVSTRLGNCRLMSRLVSARPVSVASHVRTVRNGLVSMNRFSI